MLVERQHDILFFLSDEADICFRLRALECNCCLTGTGVRRVSGRSLRTCTGAASSDANEKRGRGHVSATKVGQHMDITMYAYIPKSCICLLCSGDCEEIDYVITLLVDTQCLGVENNASLEDCAILSENRIAVGTLDINFCDILPSEGLVGKFPQVMACAKNHV